MLIGRPCLLALLFVSVLSAPGVVRGQSPGIANKGEFAERLRPTAEAPLASKKMARLLRAGKRDPQELARAWEQATLDLWVVLQESLMPTEKDVVPVPWDEFIVTARFLLEARLALASTPDERRAALEIHRVQLQQVEQRVFLRVQAGIRGSDVTDYLTARSELRLAESRFLKESEGKSAALSVLPQTEFVADPLGRKDDARGRRAVLSNTPVALTREVRQVSEESPLDSKATARLRVAALASDPRTTATNARRALTEAQEAMQERWRKGPHPFGVEGCFEPIQKCLDVELFLATNRNEREVAIRRALERTAIIEDLAERFFEARDAGFVWGDLFEARMQRLRIEYQLARERAKKD